MLYIFIQVLLAVSTVAVTFYIGYYHCQCIPVPQSTEFTTKVTYTFRCMIPALIVLLLSVVGVMHARVTTAVVNPLAGCEHIVQLSKNNLSNTVEQFSILFLSSIILITFLESPEEMRLIPLYSLLFVISRILFRIGYAINPGFRAWGFHANMYANFFIVGLIIYFTMTRGFMFGIGDSVIHDSGAAKKVEL